MAETRVTYKTDQNEELCFRCAVLYIIKNPKGQVKIKTTSYEFSKCTVCEEFIYDKIEI